MGYTRASGILVLALLSGSCHSGFQQTPCVVDGDCAALGNYYCGGSVSYCGGIFLASTEPGYCVPISQPSQGQACGSDYDCMAPSWYCVAHACTTLTCTAELTTSSAKSGSTCPSGCVLGIRKTAGGDGGLAGYRAGVCGPSACVCQLCPSLNDAGQLLGPGGDAGGQ